MPRNTRKSKRGYARAFAIDVPHLRDYCFVMGIPQQYERYTYQDYLSWPEGECPMP